MCRAIATLAYGLTVRAEDLVFAADAWTRLQHSFLFFDLVFLRRRNGGLATKKGVEVEPVTRVPNEVWEEIRHWLVKEEIADSENDLLESCLCDNSTCGTMSPASDRVRWKDFDEYNGEDECENCQEAFAQWKLENVVLWDNAMIRVSFTVLRLLTCSELTVNLSVQRILALVSAFGLDMPSHKSARVEYTANNSESVALVLIAAPSRFREGHYEDSTITAEWNPSSDLEETTMVNVSFNQLPAKIDLRFKHFIELFELQVISSSVNTLVFGPRDSVQTRSNRLRRGIPEVIGLNDIKVGRIRPRWRLYVSSDCRDL
jgi:hypothetical protein